MQLRWNLNGWSPARAGVPSSGEGGWRAGSETKPLLGSLAPPATSRIATAFHSPATAAGPMLAGANPAAFRALILHDVAREQMKKFDRLVQFLLAERRIVQPDGVEFPLAARAGAGARAPCLLTFDDGFLSQYRVARDILNPQGAKAVFFICPELIDRAERDDYGSISKKLGFSGRERLPPLMGWRQIAALAGDGHTIGAHSQSHRSLASLPKEILEEEVVSCADRLERVVRAPIDWFAYPFGGIRNIDERALRSVASRYVCCYSGVRGLNTASTPPLAMLRDHVDLQASFRRLRLILDGALDWRYVLARRRLRRMAGDALKPGNEIRD